MRLQNWSLTHFHHLFSKSELHLHFFRLDSTALSPDLLPSVHSGDRILEVNGVPVCNIAPDEVLVHTDIPWKVNEVTLQAEGLNWTLCYSLQINYVIQDTARPLQLTIEHNPQPPDELPQQNVPTNPAGGPEPCAPEKLSSTHKLPSLEEEPSPEEETGESVRMSTLPSQRHENQGMAGLRTRNISWVLTLGLLFRS